MHEVIFYRWLSSQTNLEPSDASAKVLFLLDANFCTVSLLDSTDATVIFSPFNIY